MNPINSFDRYTISVNSNYLQALEKLNANESLCLFVKDNKDAIIASITDGDLRRGLLKGVSMQSSVQEIMFEHFIFLNKNNPDVKLIEKARKNNIRLLPVLDENKKLVQLIDLRKQHSMLPIDAVLMAGGRGERLRPLTDTTPKPLLKLGEKAIIEYNLDNISKYGISQVYISVKYLAEQIENYLGNGEKYHLNINYIREEQALGTLGSITLIDDFKSDVVLVMNSDLFTNLNLEEFYNHFIDSEATMAVATFPYVVSIPYGVLDTEGTEVKSFFEKPTYTYQASAGIYLIKKEALQFIPSNTFFNATDLMDQLIERSFKITYFPIVGYWIDIGKPDDYKKAQEYIKYLH
jgi:dTDP-glucose pyrophosphorylase